jgi:hypothetical protein
MIAALNFCFFAGIFVLLILCACTGLALLYTRIAEMFK